MKRWPSEKCHRHLVQRFEFEPRPHHRIVSLGKVYHSPSTQSINFEGNLSQDILAGKGRGEVVGAGECVIRVSHQGVVEIFLLALGQ